MFTCKFKYELEDSIVSAKYIYKSQKRTQDKIIAALIPILMAAMIAMLVYDILKGNSFIWDIVLLVALFALEVMYLLIPIMFLVYLWLRSYSLTVTDKRVYGKTAFGKRVDLPFDSVSSVGTSALKGIAVGTSSGKINFKLIKNQSEIHSVISTLLAERQNIEKKTTEATVNQTVVESSSADELKKFKELC